MKPSVGVDSEGFSGEITEVPLVVDRFEQWQKSLLSSAGKAKLVQVSTYRKYPLSSGHPKWMREEEENSAEVAAFREVKLD